jgi:hypothetical protein
MILAPEKSILDFRQTAATVFQPRTIGGYQGGDS